MREQQGTGKKQILVVEDESLIAADLQKRLEKMAYSAAKKFPRRICISRCGSTGLFDRLLAIQAAVAGR
jgi:hypothetical protein